jgi:hypothetical protein
MATEIPNNKPTLVSRYSALAAGLRGMADLNDFVLDGKPLTKASILAILSAYVDANASTAAERGRWRDAVLAEKAALAAAKPVRAALKTYFQSRLGKGSPQLNTIGFEATKAGKASVKTKAVALQKNTATREARHTMGKKAKKAIKGTPPTPTVSAGTPPAATAASPPPAPPAGAPAAPAAPTAAPTAAPGTPRAT